MLIKYLDGKRFYRGLLAGGKLLISNQSYLNKINVFPVADSDTGINLAMTMKAILEKTRIGISIKETLTNVADSALNGARGNSGIIFAQYLHGLSRELPEMSAMTVKHFAQSAHKAVSHLYDSIMNPVEGTMITVIREWAENLLEQSGKTSDFFHAITDSLAAARKSLQETPQKLKVLADAGVVDAGACGFVTFLEGVVDYIHKGSLKDTHDLPVYPEEIEQSATHLIAPDKYRYCSEAVISNLSVPIQTVKESISALGDSLILAGDQEKMHIHIHTNQPEKLFDKLFILGEVISSKVDDMLRQYQISHDRKYPIGIVTDTACDLPLELLDNYQISRIPFGINFGNRLYLDKLTINPERFYHRLRYGKVHPVSSQPSPSTVKIHLEFAASHFDHIIAVHISQQLSGIYQTSSVLIEKMGQSKAAAINSRHLSVSEGLIVLRIAKAIEAGSSFNQILQEADSWIANTRIYTDINTLKYMVRGGRVKPLTGMVASIMNLKPIVSLDAEGKAVAWGKSLSRHRNMTKIIRQIATELESKTLWEYAIVHADAEERAFKYAEALTALTGKKPAYTMPLSPVVGVHNGVGTVGIGVSYV